ncbi:unnamed protein product [Lupinus luteus]|uniref:Protein SPT2 homolog n=1 Tax=Lupinus luteus TaxID=3873 RepID=A0AAV1WZI8_LUPLU
MRGYDREELEDYGDYDDYEDEREEGGEEYEEEGEEEYEEEEPRKPTKEELEYLGLRQKLKESIRKQMKKESSSSLSDSSGRKKKLPYDNYGSFFGPSQPVIAQRVIQESKSFLENQHLAPRPSNSTHINKNVIKAPNGGLKSSSNSHPPPKVSEQKIVKARKLKDTRDYSFLLSDDAPAPKKEPPPRNVSVHISEGRPAQVAGKSKQPMSNGGKLVRSSGDDRKPVSGAGHLPPKSGSNFKSSSVHRVSNASADSRKQLGSIRGNGPPGARKPLGSNSGNGPADSRKQLGSNSGNGPGRPGLPKGLPSKMSVSTMANKSSTHGMKNPVNGVHKSLPSKVHSSVPKQSVEQRKDLREQNKPKLVPRQPVAPPRAQINRPPPLKQNPKHSESQDHRPRNKVVKRRADDDGGDDMDFRSMIRSMFKYNPNKFADDDDDDNMEAGFDEILREERRSAKIAKKEDEEQLRLIEMEEERERRRRMSKKRKVG